MSQASQEEFEDDWDEADISTKIHEDICPSQMILEVGFILEWLVYGGITFFLGGRGGLPLQGYYRWYLNGVQLHLSHLASGIG